MITENLAGATFAVVDVETTGIDPRRDRVVEVACLRMRRGEIVERFCSLVDPGRPIPLEASMVHGIYDPDVRGAPALARLVPRLRALTRDALVVAHNARFDVAFLPFIAGRPVICTMRLAMHLVDAPSYRNGALRDYLRLDAGPEHRRAHRAAADAHVTAALLQELLRLYARRQYPQTVSALIEMTARPARLRRFAFGAHRGQPIESVPTEYLRRIVQADAKDWPDSRYTAERELALRASLTRAGHD
ncbi:MAG: 3'-5' exonuclease [Candidatus Baltobacteraceae bacterium]|jgi:DNA polymerase III epsilon subunit-like protein